VLCLVHGQGNVPADYSISAYIEDMLPYRWYKKSLHTTTANCETVLNHLAIRVKTLSEINYILYRKEIQTTKMAGKGISSRSNPHSIIHSLTHATEISLEAANCEATQEFPSILRSPKVHHHLQKGPPPAPILSQFNTIYNIPSYLSNPARRVPRLRMEESPSTYGG
jgi:hypothetical protein